MHITAMRPFLALRQMPNCGNLGSDAIAKETSIALAANMAKCNMVQLPMSCKFFRHHPRRPTHYCIPGRQEVKLQTPQGWNYQTAGLQFQDSAKLIGGVIQRVWALYDFRFSAWFIQAKCMWPLVADKLSR